MNDNSQLREQMWDLIYGLLEPAESRDLISRIKSDPQAARLYAEVRLQADLVGYASKVEDSSLVLTSDSGVRELAPASKERKTDKQAAALNKPRSGNMLAVVVAAALALLIAVGLFWPRFGNHQVAQNDYLVIDVEAPRDLPGGITNEVPVRIASIDGIGQLADAEATVYSADGREKYRTWFQTNDIGNGIVTIPGEAMQPGAKLKIAAAPADKAEGKLAQIEQQDKADRSLSEQVAARYESRVSSLVAELPVRHEPLVEYLFFADPVAQPGEANQFAMWSFGAISREPAPADISGAAVEDPAGNAVAEALWSRDGGYLSGYVPVPESAEPGSTWLALRDAQGGEHLAPVDGLLAQRKEESGGFQYRNDAERFNLAMANGAAEQRVRRSVEPSGGTAKESAGASPAATPPAPAIAAAPAPAAPAKPGEPLNEPPGQTLADRASPRPSLEPEVDKQTDAQQPPAQQLAATLDALATSEKEAKELADSRLKHGPAKGVSVEVPSKFAKRRLMTRAKFRGVDVAEKLIEAGDEMPRKDLSDDMQTGAASQNVVLDLPPEVNGPVEVYFYDSETRELLHSQVVVRESARQLRIDVVDGKPSYPPGETVSLTLQFTDETGQPAPGAWGGVRLWNEQIVQNYGKRPLLLADALGTTAGNVVKGERPVELAQLSRDLAKRSQTALEAESLQQDATKQLSVAGLDLKKADATPGPLAETPSDAPRPDAGVPAPESAELGAHLAAGAEGPNRYYSEALAELHEDQLETRYGRVSGQNILASNRALVRAEYDAANQQAQDERRAVQARIGRILLGGGIGGLVLLGLLALLKLPAKARIVVPSLAIAAASIVLGLGWIGVRPGLGVRQIAMVESRGGTEQATPPATPQATAPMESTPSSESLHDQTMDADRYDPAMLGGKGAGAEGMGIDSSFSEGGVESRSALAREATPAEFAAPPSAPLGSNFDQPTRNTAAGAAEGSPAGRGGAASQREGEKTFESLDRQKSQLERQLALKSGEESKTARSRATAAGEDKNLQDGASGRGAGQAANTFAKLLPKAEGDVAPAAAPLPEQPAPPGASPNGAAAATASPSAADEKDTLRLPAGKSKKGFALDKAGAPSAPARDGNESSREKADSASVPSLRLGGKSGALTAAPASIYFHPRLIADENGQATIEFTLPPVESEYRLLIDALGNGRVGSLQQVIEVKSVPK